MFATVLGSEYVTRGKHRITKPLLYQLSYVGKCRANIASWQGCGKASVILLLMLLLVIEIIKGSRQHERLANFTKRNAFGSVIKGDLEAFDGFPQWLETEPERLMMHRHDKSRAGSGCHFNRLFGCAV